MKDVRSIFFEALDKEPQDRDEFLEQACGSDPALLAEVKDLFAHLQRAGDFLENPFFVSRGNADLTSSDRSLD